MQPRFTADKGSADSIRAPGGVGGVGAKIRRRASGRGTFEATRYYFWKIFMKKFFNRIGDYLLLLRCIMRHHAYHVIVARTKRGFPIKACRKCDRL